MPWKDVIDCLRTGEGEDIEFLTSVNTFEQLLKHVVGFLNKSGGKLIIGVDDKNDHLLGSNVSKNFVDTAVKKIDPPANVTIEEIHRIDKRILLLKIPNTTNKPFSYRNKFYFRDGLEIKKLSKEEIYPIVGQTKVSKLNKRQEKTVSYLTEEENITNRIYRELFRVSHKTAHIELTDLLNRGLINKYGQGRNTAYKIVKK